MTFKTANSLDTFHHFHEAEWAGQNVPATQAGKIKGEKHTPTHEVGSKPGN